MTMEEVLDKRHSILKRPKNVTELFGERDPENLICVYRFEDLVPAHETRREDQVVAVMLNYVPEDFYSSTNFSKRGDFVMLPIPIKKEELISSKSSGVRARIDASKIYKRRENDIFSGLSWVDPDGNVHLVHIWQVIEGHRINQYGKASKNIQDRIEIPGWKKGKYSAKDSYLKTVAGKVPSRSVAEKETVILENIIKDPVDPRAHVEWTRFKATHDCELRKWSRVTFGHIAHDYKDLVTYCPHIWALYANLSERIAKETHKIIFQPGPLFTEAMLRLYLGLSYDTVKIDTVVRRDSKENVKSHSKMKKLDFAELEPALINAWLTNSNRNTLYAHSPRKGYKRMSEYNWDSHGPGMKFERD